MKEKGKFSRALKIEFNYKTNKLKRANSLRPNKIIHINKFRIPMDNINSEMRDIKKVLNTENVKKKIKNKLLIKKTNINIAKENIIVSLRRELKFQKLLNKNFKREKEMMIKTNESLINYKSEEQNKMKKRLEELNNDTKMQDDKLEKLRKTLREYRDERDQYFGNLESNELKHLSKYEKLIGEYKRLKNLYQYYFDVEVRNRKIKLDGMNKNLFAEEEDNALLKLKEKQVMGDFLRNIIRDIQIQMSEIDNVKKRMKEDKDIEKLLGKKGAEKYRQRMNLKYKSEISTLNSRYNMTFSSI